MWIFDKYSPYSVEHDCEKLPSPSEHELGSPSDYMWFCLTSLTPQGGGDLPKCEFKCAFERRNDIHEFSISHSALPGKMLAAIWWLFG